VISDDWRRPSRAALVALALGLGLAFAAAESAPLPGPPLYDGIVPVEAYRWLDPPPGEHGGAQGASATVAVKNGTSPLITLATPELTPQAQIFAAPGALTLPAGTTSLTMSITPVEPTALPTDGHIAGNVYRVTIVTQAGAPVAAKASAQMTLILRAPDPTTAEATMGHLVGRSWTTLHTDAAGQAAQFLAVVTDLGDFALLEAGAAASAGATGIPGESIEETPSGGPASPAASGEGTGGGIPTVTVFAGVAIALVLIGLAATAVLPGRRRQADRRGWSDRPPPRRRR
jgi:hypothetical protein